MAAMTDSRGHPGSVTLTQDEAMSLQDSVRAIARAEGMSVPKVTRSPPPNPPFVFPSRGTSSSAPSTFSRTKGRQSLSAFEVQSGFAASTGGPQSGRPASSRRDAPPPLPSFTFSSVPTENQAEFGSSPLRSPFSQSPVSANSISRPDGHRRGGSEFIGGDGASSTAGTGLLSSSPNRGDGPLPPPPSSGRRGHAHRRSAAVSCHDLSMILKPDSNNAARGGSAPTSPYWLEKPPGFPFLASSERAMSDPSALGPPGRSSFVTSSTGSPSRTNTPRARVGFSDDVTIIPRPLSFVSSETSTSSTVTVRPGHSKSGSISSIVSGTSSLSSKEGRRFASPTRGSITSDYRPKSAGANMGGASGLGSLGRAHGPNRSASNLLDSFGRTSRNEHDSDSASRPAISTPDLTPSEIADIQRAMPTTRITRTPSRSSSVSRKGRKHHKFWQRSILSRRLKSRTRKPKANSLRSPTPPLRPSSRLSSKGTPEEPEDNLSSGPRFPSADMNTPRPHTADFSSLQAQMKSRRSEDDDTMLIDLDAAMRPVDDDNSSPFKGEWDSVQRTGGKSNMRQRRMHSAGGVRGYLGPGFHRRAESAPEMAPFQNPRFGLSSSTMADVFEEEEEDAEWDDVKTVSHQSSKTQVEDSPMKSETSDTDSSVSEPVDQQLGSSIKSELSAASLRSNSFHETRTGSKVTDESESPRSSYGEKSSNATPTPPLRPSHLAPITDGIDELQPPVFTPSSYSSAMDSPMPSPRSPMSYDTQRISTAPSSVTDEQGLRSLLLGEPGPEVRMSVDDVPSLSSGTSTTTRESGFTPPGIFCQQRPQTSQRSGSFSSSTATKKRGSIVSLSRLISSSHGSKSKLSIEERPPASPENDKKKLSKRFSERMLGLFRQRDPSP